MKPSGGKNLRGLEIARRAAEIASDKLAVDVVVLDVKDICSFADFFTICTTESDRQTLAVYEEIEQQLGGAGATPHHREGTLASGWMLLDYGDAIVHVLSTEERQRYSLDSLWHHARVILRFQ